MVFDESIRKYEHILVPIVLVAIMIVAISGILIFMVGEDHNEHGIVIQDAENPHTYYIQVNPEEIERIVNRTDSVYVSEEHSSNIHIQTNTKLNMDKNVLYKSITVYENSVFRGDIHDLREDPTSGATQLVKITAQNKSEPIEIALIEDTPEQSELVRQWTLTSGNDSNTQYTFEVEQNRSNIFTPTELSYERIE